jgi:HEAT repeat protein
MPESILLGLRSILPIQSAHSRSFAPRYRCRQGTDVSTTTQITILVIVALNVAMTASVGVVRLAVSHQRLSRTLVEERWSPRIRQLLAGETSASTLLPLVRRGDRRHLVELLARHGERVSGIELQRLQALGRLLLPYAEPGLRSHHPETRARAAQTLATLGGPSYGEQLLEALEDESPLVVMIAAKCACAVREPDLSAAVVSHLEKFDLWNPVYLASVLATGGSHMAEHLREALMSAKTPPRTRAVAADALRLLKDPASAEAAASALESDVDREVAAACLRLLGVLGTARHAEVVRRFATGDDVVLRALSVTALGALSTGEDDIEILDAALDDPSPWVALHAAAALRAADRFELLRSVAMSLRSGAKAAGEMLIGEAV